MSTKTNDDQKYGRKHLDRRYGTISLPPGFRHKRNSKKIWKITIKNKKQSSFVFNKTCLNILLFKYTLFSLSLSLYIYIYVCVCVCVCVCVRVCVHAHACVGSAAVFI